ncbi:4-hydroxybenzoate octaprenyltransferase [bacterium endosymbiont of Bathymodiolus sp. 5 South]|jgi:4-hydroxybenzoate polyprenyltransferase|uniref:4-hydroxybenzoate octaprenyltransferase n=1 Tax=bacterium endosymbiont of Bathymodiolus sp. 5 South TaxID=1181670 RepID=UPI0010BC3039|nr:4-hydroxybenzoate octaprenyltransferase [bacterium endosymbiont of Bathymodiolus sp. 5 South]CAC9643241.1 4-hydroxybenzoate polyprenyltransferase (EC 2.5.1.39) [uncultured Gammaproteobacteria bacterium]SHN90463.1 4-hydroxybenzoate polyprenyltransferase [bacterium endosymbiont of Bathymodiolus sp. 5 South]VVH55367.1 4-hydroxybenzoate polyprenyltransferase (EC [uncultured Gammaproteobacteria bacterium]VVH62333.1 4-hydroxybenzoate polyprenyltransferase (EC [uncultured Gammaproteobacteria bacter
MTAYFRLMRLDKPIGIYLLLYPTLWALFLAAGGLPDLKLFVIFVLGVVLMRSAGCVINDYADRKIDKLIERTQNRPITTGEIHPKSALILFFLLMIVAFGLVLMTNTLTIQLAVIAGFLATLYPFTKRWTHLPQFVLGCAFAMSVPMAFAATNGSVPSDAWWVFLATVVWTVVYDTMYAMADREEDLKIGVKSSAILFAKFDRLIIVLLQLILMAILIKIGQVFVLELTYFLVLFVVLGLMFYHQFLIKKRERGACFEAFLHNQYIGMSVLLGVIFGL